MHETPILLINRIKFSCFWKIRNKINFYSIDSVEHIELINIYF